MRPSDPIKPLVDGGTVARLSLLVKHRKSAYIDAMNRPEPDPVLIGKRWQKLKEARGALDQLQKKGRKR